MWSCRFCWGNIDRLNYPTFRLFRRFSSTGNLKSSTGFLGLMTVWHPKRLAQDKPNKGKINPQPVCKACFERFVDECFGWRNQEPQILEDDFHNFNFCSWENTALLVASKWSIITLKRLDSLLKTFKGIHTIGMMIILRIAIMLQSCRCYYEHLLHGNW